MRKQSKQKSGGSRIMVAGKKPMLLALSQEEHEAIRRVAQMEERPMTQIVRRAALAYCHNILENLQKKS